MKKYSLSFLLGAVISQSALAQEFREIYLNPSPESDNILEDFRIFEVEGGGYRFKASGPIKNGAYSGFDFKIDLATGTYTTYAMDPLLVAMLVEAKQTAVWGPHEQQLERLQFATITCNITLTVQTKDVVQITLAQTDANIQWEEDDVAGTVKPLSASVSPWANPLTPALTSWSIDGPHSAYITPSIGIASSTIHGFAAADYINWDWLDDNLSTHAQHTLEVDLWPEDANGDIGHWDRDAYHYGESGGALIGNYTGGGSCM